MMLLPLTLCVIFGMLAVMHQRPWIAVGSGLLVALFGLVSLHPLIVLCGVAIAVSGAISIKVTAHLGKRLGIVAVAVAICWVPFLKGAVERYQLVEQLRPKFAYVSLADRVRATAEPFMTETRDPYADSDHGQSYGSFRNGRIRAIRSLHQSATHHFLNAPSFGVGRMSFPRIQQLEEETREPILLSELAADLPDAKLSPPDQISEAVGRDEFQTRVGEGHQKVARWFVSPESTGDVKDVHLVAGFQSHGIHSHSFEPYASREPVDRVRDAFATTRWGQEESSEFPDFKLINLQLVGLLYHETPVVYELDSLPDSATSKAAPTRPLDEFESDALTQLQSGETLVFDQRSQHIRVFGGLWNANSCQQCHDGKDNQLLGAFSYTLVATKSDS